MLDSQPSCLPSRQQPCYALDKALVASKIYSDGFKADTEAMEGELCRGGNVQIKMSEQEEASRCLKMLKRSVRHWVRSPQTQKMDVVYRTQHRGEPKSLQQWLHAAIAAQVSQGKTWRGSDLEVPARRAEVVSPQRPNLLPTHRLRVKEEQEDRP